MLPIPIYLNLSLSLSLFLAIKLWYETEQKDLRLANLLCMDHDSAAGPYVRLMKCSGSKAQTWIWVKKV